MKAYIVSDNNSETFAVVYAQTAGGAKARARRWSDMGLDEYEWTDIRAHRCPILDEHYNGRDTLDWCDMEDRILMVRYADFYCSYEIDDPDCEDCEAKEWCERYERNNN